MENVCIMYLYIQTFSYSDQYNLSVYMYILYAQKKGYPSNYREALLYIVCVCYSSIFSAQKKTTTRKRKNNTMYNDMQNGKEEKENKRKKNKLKLNYRIETTILF